MCVGENVRGNVDIGVNVGVSLISCEYVGAILIAGMSASVSVCKSSIFRHSLQDCTCENIVLVASNCVTLEGLIVYGRLQSWTRMNQNFDTEIRTEEIISLHMRNTLPYYKLREANHEIEPLSSSLLIEEEENMLQSLLQKEVKLKSKIL